MTDASSGSPDTKNLWLKRLAEQGEWPEKAFLNAPESEELLRLGLVEMVTPRAPYPGYATLTDAGYDKWENGGFQ